MNRRPSCSRTVGNDGPRSPCTSSGHASRRFSSWARRRCSRCTQPSTPSSRPSRARERATTCRRGNARRPDRGGLRLRAPSRRRTGSDRGGARCARAGRSGARHRGRPRRRRARRGLDRLPARAGRPRPARSRGRSDLALAEAGSSPLVAPERSGSSRSSPPTGSSCRSRWRSSPRTAHAPPSTTSILDAPTSR